MKIDELASIELTETTTSALLALPAPESSSLSGSPKQLVRALDNLFSLWYGVLVKEAPIPLTTYEWVSPSGQKHTVEGDDLRSRLLLSIVGYFDFLIGRYFTSKTRKTAPWPKALVLARIERFVPQDESDLKDPRVVQLRLLSGHYLNELIVLYFASTTRTDNRRGRSSAFEKLAHDGLLQLVSLAFTVHGDSERALAQRLAHRALDLARRAYADILPWNAEHRLGPFSAIRLDELSLLARRDRSLLRRYGHRNVERVFEHQLALVMQSFGLYVVPTKAGQSTVDLLCIAPTVEERLTFLLEAKTTKSPYALPRGDARALRDYVQDVRRSLPTLPSPAFVLLVSYEASKTLSAKLVKLEVETRCPVRFVTAQQIAALRERIPGPLPLAAFATQLLTGPPIVTSTIIDHIVKSYESEQSAHLSFVQAMLSARGVVPPTPTWAADRAHDHADS